MAQIENPRLGAPGNTLKLIVSQNTAGLLSNFINNHLFYFVADDTYTWQVNFGNSQVRLGANTTANWTATIYAAATAIGSILVPAGTNNGIITVSTAGSITSSNLISVLSQSNDATAADFTMTLRLFQAPP